MASRISKISSKLPVIDKKNNVKEKENRKNKVAVVSAFALGTVLGTTAGILYFSRKNGKAAVENIAKTVNDVKTASEAKNAEGVIKEITEKTTSSGEIVNDLSKNVPSNKEPNGKPPLIKGIIVGISEDIKRYLKVSNINNKNNVINPQRLDEIMTNAVGKENVVERPYLTSVQRIGGKVIKSRNYARGRVKQYKSPNGKIYVLEAHETKDGVVTRLYMNERDKHLRAYLFPDGSFRLYSFGLREAHFRTSDKGVNWMEKSPYLNNLA